MELFNKKQRKNYKNKINNKSKNGLDINIIIKYISILSIIKYVIKKYYTIKYLINKNMRIKLTPKNY